MILRLYPEGLSASAVTYMPRIHQLYRLPPLNIWLCWSMFCKPFYLCSVFINLLRDTLYCGSGLLQTQCELMALTDDGTVHCGASVACPFRDGSTLKCSNENAANALHSQNRWLWALVWNVSPLISLQLIAAVLLVFVLLPAREPPFIPHSCFPSSQRFYFYTMKCRLVRRWQTKAVQLIQKELSATAF